MKNQNRSGENVEFHERANEDRYFALKEHERIDEMKVDFQNAEAARRERQVGNCPMCAGKLEKYGFMGFVLHRCDSCQGVWLKPDELRGIIRKAARGPLGAFFYRYFSKVEHQ
ncbi:MAG TPA: zf-TFIIB domain-containing protein [Candidatus Binatia bacterium]|nr:zf-TFIIB domain-containing protein [Candidatus Binatia bacterium]